jgi:GH43 family beta-xylosidase
MKTFCNPLEDRDAPDPFMTYDKKTGYYYSLFTCSNRLELYRSRHAADILTDHDSIVLFRAAPENGIYGSIWAPEMHKAPNGKWYIYTSGTHQPGNDPANDKKCLFVMESESEDPFEGFHFKCKMDEAMFAIDPTVYTDDLGKQYMCYSYTNKGQVLEIRELVNPYTFGEKRAVISRAEYSWEMVPPYVGNSTINEGAFFLKNKGRLFIIYSGNGCWSDDYCFGVLEYMGGDMCSSQSWKKHPEPIFVKGNGVYGPGHASFFRSPDDTEVWCAYHGMKESNISVTYAPRYFHLQKVEFDESGYPVMGIPVGSGVELCPPSGEIE